METDPGPIGSTAGPGDGGLERTRDPEGDGRLDDLVGEYLDRINEGGFVDPAEVRAAHPDLAEEILQDLEAFIGRSGRTEETALGELGDYRLIRRIGRGGMGVVYQAWQKSVDRAVALKVLPAGLSADGKTLARFFREAKMAAQLHHPNVVAVHGMGVDRDTPHYTMELVEGETLARVLARRKKGELPELPECLRIAEAFAGAAEGLQHAHSKGIIHRDIKPSNLILERADPTGTARLRILDFGLARLEGQESLTRSGDFLGTPLYMSPEQAMAKRVQIDYRTDLYSLGATLHEMLASGPPFEGKSTQETLSRIICKEPPPLRGINPKVSRDLETIVLKCLEKDPAERYRTAEALAQDLHRAARGDPIEARPQTGLERWSRRAWRWRWRLAAALGVVVLFGVIGWLGTRELQARRERVAQEYEESVLRAMHLLQLTAQAQGLHGMSVLHTVIGVETLDDLFHTSGRNPVREALGDLKLAEEVLPDRSDARYQRARGLFLIRQDQEALEEIEEMARRDPTFVPALLLKADHYRSLGALETARGIVAQARSVAGDGWRKAWIEAEEKIRKGEWSGAIEPLTRFIDRARVGKEPFLGAVFLAHLDRALVRIQLGNPIEAMKDIALAQERSPGALEPILFEAKAWCQLDQPEHADKIFKEIHAATEFKDLVAFHASEPFHSFLNATLKIQWVDKIANAGLRERTRSLVLFSLGKYFDAEAAARKAIQLAPENPVGYYCQNIMLERMGKLSESIRVADEALLRFPESGLLHWGKGRSLWFQGAYAQAIPVFEKAIAIDPKDGRSRVNVGSCLLRLGQVAEGLAAHQLEEEMTPTEPWAFQHTATDWGYLGNFERAAEAIQRAIQLDPTHSDYHFEFGNYLAQLGQTERAFEEHRLAARLYPREAFYALQLGHEWIQRRNLSEGLSAHLEGLEWHPESVALIRSIDEELRWITPQGTGELNQRILKALEASIASENPEARLLARLTSAELAVANNGEEAPRVLVQVFRGFQDAEAVTGGLEEYLAAAGRLSQKAKAADLDRARAAFSQEERFPALLFEGWLLEREGKHAEAASRLAEACRLDPESVAAPWLLAHSLAAAREPARAAAALRERIERGPKPGREFRPLWELWSELGLQDRGRDPTVLRTELPASAEDPYRDDAAWLFERCAREEPVRIHCGGGDYRDPTGLLWSRDRFFAGGSVSGPVLEEIEGTLADALYQGGRSFRGEEALFAGYRFPVPAGRYRLRLHFAETRLCLERERTFDVAVQGEMRLFDYEPARGGFLRAQVEEMFTIVEEGVLEIRFLPRNGGAKVSAVEFERVE